MNKILILIEKNSICFSKYNRKIEEANLNNTNVINIKNLKFTEEYILENMDLVSAFINLVVLKFNINRAIIKNNEISETVLNLVKLIDSIKNIYFKEDKELNYTISSCLLENKNLEYIECYSLPEVMFNRFKKDQIKTRNKFLTTCNFFKYNNINTYSDIFNKDKIIIPEVLTNEDINPIVYLLQNNLNIKKIEFKKYNRKNLESVLSYFKLNKLKRVNIKIWEDKDTTSEILKDVNYFEKLNRKYNVNIKIKYSKEYKEKNKIKEVNINLLKIIFITCVLFSLFFIILFNILEDKSNVEIIELKDEIKEITSEEEYINEISNNKQENNETVTNNNYSRNYSELVKRNSDTIGWITVNNTKIDYPVVQTTNNEYYLDYSFDKTRNIAGWIYADYRNDFDNINKNTIIYGHNMVKDGGMFTTLENVLNKEWYENVNNQKILFSIKGKDHYFKIFSIYTIPETLDYLKIDFVKNSEYLDFINLIKNRSIYDFKTNVVETDKILTLSTCYKDNKHRLVVHAKLIKE